MKLKWNNGTNIYVTQPSLPPLEEVIPNIEKIWDNKWVTNNGPFHQEFERALCKYLGARHVSLFTNGTLALITALKSLVIKGEVITTPFSFVATAHALRWNGINPVFVDIESEYCNLDPEKIEAAITPKTTAILPVHVYGNPCNIERIKEIADRHNLRVIYDAAHAFGIKIKGRSILNFGDLSVLSFHATKVFNTFEGGAIICHDEKMKNHIDLLKNFGFAGETQVIEVGINAKMNELQAVLGLVQLGHFHEYVEKRKTIAAMYIERLGPVKGIEVIPDLENTSHNYAYFPVFIDKNVYKRSRDEVYSLLKKNNIFARRYFYPLISQFPMYRDLPSAHSENLPVASRKADQVLCLPLYPGLQSGDVERICDILKNC